MFEYFIFHFVPKRINRFDYTTKHIKIKLSYRKQI